MGDKRLWFKAVMLLVVGLMLVSFMGIGCSEDDEDTVTPSHGSTPPEDFQGSWYLYAKYAVGGSTLYAGNSPLLELLVDSTGTWKMNINGSRQAYGDAYWKSVGDVTYLDLYQEVYGETKLYKSIKVASYSDYKCKLEWPGTATSDTVDAVDTVWVMARGTNKIFGFVSDGYNDNVALSTATITVSPLDMPDSIITTFQPDGDGFYMRDETEPVTYSITHDNFDYTELDVTPSLERPKFAIFALQPPVVGHISGTVKDEETDRGIAEAQVWSNTGDSTITDSEGNYSFDVHAGSRRILYASHPDYHQNNRMMNIAADADITVNWNLTPLPTTGVLNVHTYSIHTELPIGYSTVIIDDSLEYHTNNYGNVSIVLTGGAHDVLAQQEGYRDTLVTAEVVLGGRCDIDVFLTRLPASVSGMITDAVSSEPIQDVQVVSEEGDTVYTDASGLYAFNVWPNNQTIFVTKDGYFDQQAAITPYPGDEITLNFELIYIPDETTLDTLVYDPTSVTAFGYIPGGILGTTMTTENQARLIELWYYTTIDPGFTQVDFDAVLYSVTSDSTEPVQQIYSTNIMRSQNPSTYIWVKENIQLEDIQVNGHFFVGFEDIGGETFLGYNENYINHRTWGWNADNGWMDYRESLLVNIRVVIQNLDGSYSVLGGDDFPRGPLYVPASGSQLPYAIRTLGN